MIGPARINEKTGASITFGLGSFILMSDIIVVVITKGDQRGNLFEMGFPTILGYAGILLWLIGSALLIFHWVKNGRTRKPSVKPIFLRGKQPFKCGSCGHVIDTEDVEFHKRVTCKCGTLYDLYQDLEDQD